MVDILPEFFADVKLLVASGILVMAVLFVIKTWRTTQSLVPTLGALLLGAVALYLVSNYTFLRGEIENEREIHQRGRPVLDGE